MSHCRISVVVVITWCMGCGGNPPTPLVQNPKVNSSDQAQPASTAEQTSPPVASATSVNSSKPTYNIPKNLRPYDVKSNFPLMTAEQIAKEFTTDEAAAKAKYKDKAVHLTGTVAAIDSSDMGYNLYLKGVQGSGGDVNVCCGIALLDRYSKARSEIIKVGDPVTLFGDVYISSLDTSLLTEVVLLTCFIVEQP